MIITFGRMKGGEKNLWVGWILNPFFLSSWIGAPLHYWNSVAWSISTQVGFYFMFPSIARVVKRRLHREEGGSLLVSVVANGNANGKENVDKKQVQTTGAVNETDGTFFFP